MGFTSREKLPPQHHGVHRSVPSPRSVVVVGGGIAGLAAATVLAERGVSVTVVEPLRYLGGRAGSWEAEHDDGGGAFHQDRGFHAFFRQYYNLRSLLTRVSPDLSILRPLPDYPVIAPDGAVETFAYVPTAPIANFVGLIQGSTTFKWRHLLRANIRKGLAMVAWSGEPSFSRWDGITAKEYLDAIRLPPKPRAMLFDVFAHSFFNPEEEMSAAEMLQYFHFYFMGNPEGLAFDVLDQPLSEAIWNPLRTYLEARGVTFCMGTAVDAVARAQGDAGATWVVQLSGDEAPAAGNLKADGVVLAANVQGLRAIVAASPELGTPAWRDDIAALEPTAYYAVLRLWFDGDVARHRVPFASVSGAGILDSVALYHRLTEPSARWHDRTGGAEIELHAYAVPRSYGDDSARVERELVAQLVGLYPEVASLTETQRRFHMMQDCPSFKAGTWERRPRIETPHEGLVLAGDLCWVPMPSGLMERATASGFMAANRLLAGWNVMGEDLWSVPTRGVLSGLLS
jgi:isorenieratene synthase